ncbi:c6 zinc finger domain containing [Fusarium agapanthi]|uniref:C6 zinc finger domain containing n=1 Tax=Fusarium agapanthi TaxID=1803897 RepID=A0A9P5BDK7_9HYPO|nr:c6 zinc finger domain containing [Fusarium agapanthi]
MAVASDRPHIGLRAFHPDEPELLVRCESDGYGVPGDLLSQSEFPERDPVFPQSHTAQTTVDLGSRCEYVDYGATFDGPQINDLSLEMSFDISEDLDDLYEILAGLDSFDAPPVHYDTSQPDCPTMPGGVITGSLNTEQSPFSCVNLLNDDISLSPGLHTDTTQLVEGTTEFQGLCRDDEFGEIGIDDDETLHQVQRVIPGRICEVLCIKDSSTGNPWRKIVWSMPKEHTALYHALAAMSCFQKFNNLPEHRAIGLRHLNYAVQQLAVMETNDCSTEDPLIGCARPLFPLLGGVADLVNCVRRRQEKLNSPAIVSEAVLSKDFD